LKLFINKWQSCDKPVISSIKLEHLSFSIAISWNFFEQLVKSKTANQHQVGRSGIMLTLDNVSSVIQSERRRGVRDFVQARILDKTICFCVKTVQIQDFCGESDQSKLRATRFSGLVCLLCFIVVNHRHLPISRRSLKLNTEDLLSKILYQPSPKKRQKFPAL
jgi:hypothetical protein